MQFKSSNGLDNRVGGAEPDMSMLMIGELARRAGVAPSTLRYYEKVGLLPSPPRESGRRQYDPRALGRIRIILFAREAGFSVAETRAFLNAFPADAPPAARWRELAKRKLSELDEIAERIGEMKRLLRAGFSCECRRLEECELLAAKRSQRNTSCRLTAQ